MVDDSKKNKKGFAGFESLASDDDDLPTPAKKAKAPKEAPPEPTPAPEVKAAAPEPQPAAPKEKPTDHEHDLKAAIDKMKKGGFWWVIAAVVVIGLIVANADDKGKKSTYTAPPTKQETEPYYPPLPAKYNHHDDEAAAEPVTKTQPAPVPAAAPVTQSASFDCRATRKTPLELLICADAELSALDGKVGEAYRAALKASTDREATLAEQRQFLKNRTEICNVPFQTNISEYQANSLIACLKRQYTARLAVLEKQQTPAAPAAPKQSSSDVIQKATGITLMHVDAQGLPISGNDYNPGNKFVVSFQGKTLLEDDSSAYVNLESLYLLNDEQVVLLSQASGGNACNATYRLISIYNGTAQITKEFGNCAVPEITKTTDDELVFVFYDGYGKREVGLYKNHQYAEKKISIPLKSDPDSANGFRYLKKYAEKKDVESMLQDRKLNPRLVRMMGGSWDKFKQRLDLYSVSVTDKFIIVTGMMAHSGGSDEAIMMIALDGGDLFTATLESDYSVTPPLQTIQVYSNQTTTFYTAPPAELQQWIAAYKTPNVHWNYASKP